MHCCNKGREGDVEEEICTVIIRGKRETLSRKLHCYNKRKEGDVEKETCTVVIRGERETLRRRLVLL